MKLDIRWGRTAIVALAMTAALLSIFIVSLVREYREQQLHPLLASDAEQSAILRSLLKEERYYAYWYQASQPPPLASSERMIDSVVVADASYPICDQQDNPDLGALCRAEKAWPRVRVSQEFHELDVSTSASWPGPAIPDKLAMELLAANRISTKLPDPRSPGILIRPRAEIERLAKSPNWSTMAGQFVTLFPHSSMVIEVSRAVLSEDRTVALVYVEFFGVPVGHHGGTMYLLVRTADTWRTRPKPFAVMFDQLQLWMPPNLALPVP